MHTITDKFRFSIWTATAAVTVLINPITLQAQGALEEIVVTAQRREQSLQEVPISIEAISADEIRQQGYRDMDQLAEFSPSINIDVRIQDQDIAIRGIGTTGNNLSLEQAVPTFIDGVHYGRTSQVKNAFMDLERIEVLRGPQPVYFGQNATAGAFSLVTKKPTPTWEGDLTAQYGNGGRQSIEGGAGGPITDTIGIRIAGKWDRYDGHLTDIISGDKFPNRRDWAGRLILQWTPNDRFQATLKYSFTDFDGGSDGNAISLNPVCRDAPENCDITLDGITALFMEDFEAFDFIPLTYDHSDGLGIRTGPRYFYMGPQYDNEDATACATPTSTNCGGNVDIREIARQHFGGDIAGREWINPWDGYLNLTYRLANEVELSSLTAFTRVYRGYLRDNSNSPFLQNVQNRTEDQNTWSQEFRVSSPTGGTFEWMAGAYWQIIDLELMSDTVRGELRRPRRLNLSWEDGEWRSAFASLTYNFWDDRMSIDVGARYTDIHKDAFLQGFSSTYILSIEPVSRSGYVAVPGGFTYPFNRQRFIPTEWDAQPVEAMTPLSTVREGGGPFTGVFDEDRISPQVTLRYRPTDNVSTYARWAQAFKAGGFDTSAGTIPDSDEAYEIDSEYAEGWEIGAKGTFWDGRARGGLSLFWLEVEDLQIATTAVRSIADRGSISTNAGLQRSRGAEFDFTWLAAERLTLGLNGALMDGKMVEFDGAGCTNAEFSVADTGPCISEAESEELTANDPGGPNDSLAGLIDRSGQRAPRSPKWVFTGDVNYWYPVLDGHKLTFNGKFKVSDGYISNVESFSQEIKMNRHADMNLSLGFGDINDTWEVSAWARNILEAVPSYNPEYDVAPSFIRTGGLSPSHLMSYGVRLKYNYNQ